MARRALRRGSMGTDLEGGLPPGVLGALIAGAGAAPPQGSGTEASGSAGSLGADGPGGAQPGGFGGGPGPGFASGGGFGTGNPPSVSDIMRARGRMLREEAPPQGGGAALDKPNFASLVGVAFGGVATGWRTLGPYPGPVLLVPYLTLPQNTLLAHPFEPPPLTDANAMVRSRGNGLLYLPAGGVPWAVKYTSATGDTLRVLVIDARNPNVLAWYMASLSAASRRTPPASVTVGVASTQLLAQNEARSAWGVQVLTAAGSIALTWGAAATYAAGPPIVTNGIVLSAGLGPLFFSDEINVKEQINAIRTGGADIDVAVFEWTD